MACRSRQPNRAAAAAQVVVATIAAAPILADSSPCGPSDASELLHLSQAQARVASGNARPDAMVVRTTLRARLFSRGGHSIGVTHDYRAHEVLVPVSEPQTNGHVHALSLRYRFNGPRWEVAASPVLATSSNVGRHPRAIDRRLIDWHGLLRRKLPLNRHTTIYVGVCRDDRFGRVAVRPVLGVQWAPGNRFTLTLGWPNSHLTWDVHPSWHVDAAVAPIGGKWTVYDNDLARRTAFQAEGWRLTVGLGLRPAPRHRIAINVGRVIRRSFRFHLDNGARFSSAFDDARTLGVEWQWLREPAR